MMIQAHMNEQSAVPWWAAFGAPLIGVPLLVALLALSGGGGGAARSEEPADAAGASYAIEQVEGSAMHTVDLPADYDEAFVLSRC